MIAQQMAQDRPSIFRRMILVGTAPRGGEDIMHLEKLSLANHLPDPKLRGYAVLQTTLKDQITASVLWRGGEMKSPDAPIAKKGFFVAHFLTVKDQARSKEFYVGVLGGKVVKPENP